MGSARFARQKDFLFRACGCRESLRLRFLLIVVIFFAVKLFVGLLVMILLIFVVLLIFVRRLEFELNLVAECRDVQSVLVRRVGFGFCNGLRSINDFLHGRFVIFPFFCFFLGEVFLNFFLYFVLFEDRAARCAIRRDDFTNFVLLGVNQAGRESGAFFVAQFDAVFCFLCDGLSLFESVEFFVIQLGDFFSLCSGVEVFSGDFRGFGTTGEQPAGQRATRTSRSGSRARQKSRTARLCALCKVGLRIVSSSLFDRRDRRGGRRTIAELRERLSGKEEFFFGWSAGTGLGTLLAITAVVRAVAKITTRAAPVIAATVAAIFVVAAILAVTTLR
jgi:hypothetical protein